MRFDDSPLAGWAHRHPRFTDVVVGWVSATDNQAVYLVTTMAAQISIALGTSELVPGVLAKTGFLIAIWRFGSWRGSLRRLSLGLLVAGTACLAVAVPLLDAAPIVATTSLLAAVICSPSTLLLTRLRQSQTATKPRTAGRIAGVWVAGLAVYAPLFGLLTERCGIGAAIAFMALLRLTAAIVTWLLVPPDGQALPDRSRAPLRIAWRDPLTRAVAALSLLSSVPLAFMEIHLILELQRRDHSVLTASVAAGAAIAFGSLFGPLAGKVAERGATRGFVLGFGLLAAGCVAGVVGALLPDPGFLGASAFALAGGQAGSTVVATLRSTIPEWRVDDLTPARVAVAGLATYGGGFVALLGGVVWRAGGIASLMTTGLLVCFGALAGPLRARGIREVVPPLPWDDLEGARNPSEERRRGPSID